MGKNISDDQFEQEVLKSEKLVLVDFWAEWCGPCKMVAPLIEQIAEEMKDKVEVVKMEIDQNPKTPSEMGVRSIPTLMLFDKGKQVDVKIGVHTKDKLVEWISSNLTN